MCISVVKQCSFTWNSILRVFYSFYDATVGNDSEGFVVCKETAKKGSDCALNN